MATILIVDDRPPNREYLTALLGYQGHRLREAADGLEALALAQAEPPDLIIADIVMPVMDGYELARQVRAEPRLAQTRIIFLTSSYIVANTRRLAEACGVTHVIAKPAEPELILTMVAAALETPVPPVKPAPSEFHREHMRLLTDTLAKKVEELEAEIEERKRAEIALRASEARLRSTMDAMLEGAQIISPDWRYVYVNDAAAAQGRMPKAALLGRRMGEVYPGIEQTPLFAVLRRCMEERSIQRLENEFTYPDGATGWFYLSVQPVAEGVFILSQDITERKHAQERLAYQAEVLEHVRDSIVAADSDLRVTVWNRGAEATYGWTADEVLGRDVREVFRSEYPQAAQLEAERALEAGPFQVQTIHHRKDGAPIHVEGLIVAQRDAAGAVTRYLYAYRDVSERVRRERELEAIAAVSTALRAALTQAEMVPLVLEQVSALLGAGAGAVALQNAPGGGLRVELGHGALAGLTGQTVPATSAAARRVLAAGAPQVSPDVAAEPLALPLEGLTGAAALVPLMVRQQLVGALWAGRASPFSEVEVRVLRAIADIAANALQRAMLHAQTEQRLQRLAALRAIDAAIMNSLDLAMTLNILLEQVLGQLRVDAGDILLLNRGLQVLEYAEGRGFRSRAAERARLRLGEGYAGKAALERRVVAVPHLRVDDAVFRRRTLLAEDGVQAIVCAPLVARGQVLGVLEVFHRAPLNPDPDWLTYFETLADQAAIAVADARLFTDLQRSNADLRLAYDTTLEGWSAALDLRDHETEGHSQRVTESTLRLAQALGVADSELAHMRRGALLHDIGKMGIPDAILHKPGKLTDEEWVVMRQHPTYAYQLLAPIAYLRPALDIPYCHHEKWDGTGYPRQLAGEAIPLAARIFAVVDVWDALRSDRPYRAGWPESQVLAYLQEQAGRHFDPRVVESFVALLA